VRLASYAAGGARSLPLYFLADDESLGSSETAYAGGEYGPSFILSDGQHVTRLYYFRPGRWPTSWHARTEPHQLLTSVFLDETADSI